MDQHEDDERLDPHTRLPSTIYEWKHVMVKPHPQGTVQRPQATTPRRRKRRRALDTPIQVTMTYVGGAEGNVVLRADGFAWRYHGGMGILDVLMHFKAVKP